MELNLPTSACDSNRLESFLSGDLSGVQERDFLLHLNTCEPCRRSLQQQAAEPEAWMEAEKLLKPSKFDSLASDEHSDSGVRERRTRQPLQIQAVLDTLGPTDDPAMLGRLGGYEVSGVVGAGGMGVVLKAIDKSLDRTVAIKVMAPHLATSGAARKRFAREAKAAAAVLHPNVIAIHSVSNDEALPYLVMPYVRGTSLQRRLDEEGPLSLQETLRIGSQIAAGLTAAHAQGLVHRDISPANILLEEGVERVTITDFGLARAVDDAAITTSGMLAGTPQYMSPEQARGEAVDGRSDLFSLGSVLYAIATGRPPFRAETTHGVLRRITDDEPTSIREINPDIPDWLRTIIARLMSKRREGRYQSAAEVAELLGKCLAHVQQPAVVPLPAALIPARTRRPWNFILRPLGAIAMLAVFALGILAMALWQASEPPDISGKWTGPEWGEVTLHQKRPGEYEGTYTDTFKKMPGTIELKWSRLEGRYKGTWREGEQRSGKLAVRLVEDQIRGAWTTDKESLIDPGTPELADLLWKRSGDKAAVQPAVQPGAQPAVQPGAQPPAQPLAAKISASDPTTPSGTPTRLGHFTTGHGIKIACSADGKLIAIANGNPTRILQTNGTSRVKGDWKPSADIIDIGTRKIVVSLKLTTEEEDAVLAATERISHVEVTAVAFSPAGDVVAVGTNIGQVKLFDARTGELIRSLDDEQPRLADKDTPENWKPLKRALGSVASLAFSPDGSLLAACGSTFREYSDMFDGITRLTRAVTGPGRLKVWEVKTGTLKHDLVGHSHANDVAFSLDGNLLASAGSWSSEEHNGSGVLIWNPQTGTKMRTINTDANAGTHVVEFSPTNKLVAIASQHYDKENDTSTTTVSLTYALSGITEWQRPFPGGASPKAFAPDGKTLLVLSGGQSIHFVDTQTGTTKREIKAADSPEGGPWVDFAITSQGRQLAIAAVSEEEGSVVLWDLAGPGPAGCSESPPKSTSDVPKRLHHFPTADPVKAIAVSPDGKLIAIAKPDPDEGGTILYLGGKRLVEILDAETAKTVAPLRLTTDDEDTMVAATKRVPAFEVTALAFSPDGNVVAVGTSVGQVKLFNARTGELVRSLDDEKAKLAETKTPEKLKSLKRAMGGVSSLAFSPDGSLLAMTGSSFEDVARNWGNVERGLGELSIGPGRLKVWDVKTGTLKHDLVGHSQANAAAFSPDGSVLASAGSGLSERGYESGVITWDLQTGAKVRAILIQANGGTHAVTFSPSKKLVAIGALNFDKENDTRSTTLSVAYPLSGITDWQQSIPGGASPKAFSPDGKIVLVQCGGESIRFVDVETGQAKHEIKAADSPDGGRWSDFAIAARGSTLVIGGAASDGKGFVEIWDIGNLGATANPK